jgi:hypothetical protein
MQEEGRKIAVLHSFAYPLEVESAALEYVMDEFAMLGLIERER